MSNAQNISNSGLEEIKAAVYDKGCDICAQTRDSVKAVYNNIISGDHDDASATEVNQIYQRVVSEHDSLSKLVSIINTAKEYYADAESQLASKMQLDSLTIDKCATIGALIAATSLTAWQTVNLNGNSSTYEWFEYYRNLKYKDVEKKLLNLMKDESYFKPNAGHISTSSEECKGFAKQVFTKLHPGEELPATAGNDYQLDVAVTSPIKAIGNGESIAYNGGTVFDKADEVSSYLSQAHVGDVVQMRTESYPHTAIISEIYKDENGKVTGLEFYDSNWVNNKTIKRYIATHSMNVNELAAKINFQNEKHTGGLTVYTPK